MTRKLNFIAGVIENDVSFDVAIIKKVGRRPNPFKKYFKCGHEASIENTKIYKSGKTCCKVCANLYNKKYRMRKALEEK